MTNGISGIGYPMGLGNYGLGTTSAYGSYDSYMPSMLGMSGMTGMYPSYGTGYGMMGMYNPTFMAQMQQQIEQMQLQHAGDMHSMVLNNEVRSTQESDKALISKLLTNASVQADLKNLYNKVREGDQNGICEEFDNLRNQIYHTYKDELEARGDEENPAKAARRIVNELYYAYTGNQSALDEDIKRYGDGAMMNGFMQGFRKGHHDKYVDETLNHCFGDRIDQKDSKDVRQTIGKVGGSAASVLEKGIMGTIAGVGATGLITGFGKVFTPDLCRTMKVGKWLKAGGKWGTLIGLLGGTLLLFKRSNA